MTGYTPLTVEREREAAVMSTVRKTTGQQHYPTTLSWLRNLLRYSGFVVRPALWQSATLQICWYEAAVICTTCNTTGQQHD